MDTDASTAAIAGVLQQEDPRINRVVAYCSKFLTETEQRWSIREIEAYAIVWSILHSREFLIHTNFVVRTDHESLKWVWQTERNKRIARWTLALQEFQFEIHYRAGKYQQHVDIFSRDIATYRGHRRFEFGTYIYKSNGVHGRS